MRQVLWTITAILIFDCAESHAQQVKVNTQWVSQADNFGSIFSAYRDLFIFAGEDLSPLRHSADDSIATQAAWEDARRPEEKVRRYEDRIPDHKPTKELLDRFLGFLEARTRATPPKWWREGVRDCRFTERDYPDPPEMPWSYHSISPGKPETNPYHYTGLVGVWTPVGSTVKENGKSYVYESGDESITIPDELFQRCDAGNLCDNVSGTFTVDRCYLAIHDNGGLGYRHVVACVSMMSGEIIWKARAFGCFQGGGSGPGSDGWVSVQVHEDRVVIFGMAATGFWVQGFRTDDGETVFRFSTGF